MTTLKLLSVVLCYGIFTFSLAACEGTQENQPPQNVSPPVVKTGADKLMQGDLSALLGKRVGVVANQTSLVGKSHLIDSLLARGVNVVRAFAPEHGFRGQADAGQRVSNMIDSKTGLSIVSLYGKSKKPSVAQLANLDLVIFDIQDVGARFYTYLSTLAYVMEACAEQGIPVMVLDRPNPNGWYVDGPVMEPGNTSFIGLHQIPIVHGMTLAEYARLLNGEGWLANGVQVELTWKSCEHYRHEQRWADTGLPWVAPSPNLASVYAAYLYPAICWFEPTPVSVGRGTDSAFTLLGATWFSPPVENGSWEAKGLRATATNFTPVSLPGKSTYPKFQDQMCQGLDFQNEVDGASLFLAGIGLLQEFYQQHQAMGFAEPFFKQ
ncbi:MAG: DUF1343 domain-containing protein, partial [Bacteroidota bacterium]